MVLSLSMVRYPRGVNIPRRAPRMLFGLIVLTLCIMWLSSDLDVAVTTVIGRSNKSVVYDSDKHRTNDALMPASSDIWDGVNIRKLTNITKHAEVIHLFEGNMSSDAWTCFNPGLNVTQRRLMRDLIGCFVDIAKKNNVTYFMYGGTLIGSYRHHGMVPWDDDVDVAVSIEDAEILKTAFGELSAPFQTVTELPRWKLFYHNISMINEQRWSFPFLDISFFKTQQGIIHDIDPVHEYTFRYNVSDVFPLVLRPYWDMWLPAPKHTRIVLDTTYAIEQCVSSYWSHSTEHYTKIMVSLPCEQINEFYPHVRRIVTHASGITEELVFNGSVEHSVNIPHMINQ